MFVTTAALFFTSRQIKKSNNCIIRGCIKERVILAIIISLAFAIIRWRSFTLCSGKHLQYISLSFEIIRFDFFRRYLEEILILIRAFALDLSIFRTKMKSFFVAVVVVGCACALSFASAQTSPCVFEYKGNGGVLYANGSYIPGNFTICWIKQKFRYGIVFNV